jgi:hypothetical protein
MIVHDHTETILKDGHVTGVNGGSDDAVGTVKAQDSYQKPKHQQQHSNRPQNVLRRFVTFAKVASVVVIRVVVVIVSAIRVEDYAYSISPKKDND